MEHSTNRVGIVGISGYSGLATLEILLKHPNVRVTYVGAKTTHGKISDICPRLRAKTKLVCELFDIKKAIDHCDLIFLAVPHTTSMAITPQLLKAEKRVIDLTGDYRLQNASTYKKWYGEKHLDKANLSKAVYGLPELYKEKIKKSDFVANPGCYPTGAILALAPVVSIYANHIHSIIIDAKSGVTGAGKKVAKSLMAAEVNENFKAYKIFNHQHTPEIDLYLSRLAGESMNVVFVPHLAPINRGIFETIYVKLNEKINLKKLHAIYNRFYKVEPFIRILPLNQQPELKNIVYTNYCDIGMSMNNSKNMLILTVAFDNLLKGAGGQAVQNMNLMCKFKEEEGLL